MRALHRVALGLLALAGCGAIAAAGQAAESGSSRAVAIVSSLLGDKVRISAPPSRLLEIDLEGATLSGATVAGMLTQLALEDQDDDRVLLRGVLIRNGRVRDQLTLEDLTVPFALAFSSLELGGGTVFANMTFAKKVTFTDVSWSSSFFVDRSSFLEGLSISGNSSLRPRPDAPDEAALYINKTEISRDLTISGLEVFGASQFYDNQISSALRIDRARFYGTLKIRNNKFAGLMIYRSIHLGYVSLYTNDIDRLELKGDVYLSGFDVMQNEIFDMAEIIDISLFGEQNQFALNRIGRELYFKPEFITHRSGLIMLAGNTVQGLATVAVPESRLRPAPPGLWQPLRLDLGSSAFHGKLQIRLQRETPPKKPDQPDKEPDRKADEKPETPPARAQNQDYCYRGDGAERALTTDLSAAEAARFDWDLPIGDCRFVWAGNGFHYQQWISQRRPADHVAGLLDWRFQIAGPQPSALVYMSEHLRSQGWFTDSRNIMFEAKKMDYEPSPDCNPTWNVSSSTFWGSDGCVVQSAMFDFLYTSGFGVKPEYALFFLVCTWLLGVVVYHPYVWIMRARTPGDRPIVVIPHWLDRLLERSYRRLYAAAPGSAAARARLVRCRPARPVCRRSLRGSPRRVAHTSRAGRAPRWLARCTATTRPASIRRAAFSCIRTTSPRASICGSSASMPRSRSSICTPTTSTSPRSSWCS